MLSPKTTVVSKETRTLNNVVLSNSELEQFCGRLGTVGNNPVCGRKPVEWMDPVWVVTECVLAYGGRLFWAKP